jgi:hypothetical protein
MTTRMRTRFLRSCKNIFTDDRARSCRVEMHIIEPLLRPPTCSCSRALEVWRAESAPVCVDEERQKVEPWREPKLARAGGTKRESRTGFIRSFLIRVRI